MKESLSKAAARAGFAFALLCCAASAALAQERLGARELPGARLERVLTAFEEHPANEIATWDRRVCVGLSGVRIRRHAAILADRIAMRVFEQGLEPGRPNCVPNVLVFVTPEADRLAEQLAAEYRSIASEGASGEAWINQEALASFVSSDAPVRWWHAPPPSERAQRGRSEPVVIADVFVPSRPVQRQPAAPREAFPRVLVVIDAARAEGASLETLGDIAAMAAMAQIRQDRLPASVDSVLNRFVPAPEGVERQEADRLTDWDQTRLHGLYAPTAETAAPG